MSSKKNNFTLPTEVVEVTGCNGCMFNVFDECFELPNCIHPIESNHVIRLVSTKEAYDIMFTNCPLKKTSLTIKLKNND